MSAFSQSFRQNANFYVKGTNWGCLHTHKLKFGAMTKAYRLYGQPSNQRIDWLKITPGANSNVDVFFSKNAPVSITSSVSLFDRGSSASNPKRFCTLNLPCQWLQSSTSTVGKDSVDEHQSKAAPWYEMTKNSFPIWYEIIFRTTNEETFLTPYLIW